MVVPTEAREVAEPASQIKLGSSKRELWSLGIFLTVVYVAAVAIANRRFAWYDELLTFDIARAPTLRQLFEWVHRFENHLPIFYLLSRYSMRIFGPTKLALRLPSIIEFYLGSAAVFAYVRRRAGNTIAGLAVALVWAGDTFYYATEARPYALMFMCFACLLVSWEAAARGRYRRVTVPAVALFAIGLLLAHAFGPLSLYPILVAEALRFRSSRKPDYLLWAALLLPCVAVLAYIPMLGVYRGTIISTFERASLRQIYGFFYDSMNVVRVAVFLALLALLLLPKDRGREQEPPVSTEDKAILICLLLNPVLLNLTFMVLHGGFYYRYCITTNVAIYVAFAMLLARRLRPGQLASTVAILGVLLGAVIAHRYSRALSAHPLQPIPWARLRPDLPVVDASGQTFYEMNHYEAPRLLSRLYYLKDRAASLRYEHTNFFQDFEAPDDMKAAGFPIAGNVASYASFVRGHPQFLVVGAPGEWLLKLLQADGATIKSLGDFTMTAPYPRESHVYLVVMPRP
jgi:hypothetical protein